MRSPDGSSAAAATRELLSAEDRAEGIPVVLMEAMAYELPVVAPATTGSPSSSSRIAPAFCFDPAAATS